MANWKKASEKSCGSKVRKTARLVAAVVIPTLALFLAGCKTNEFSGIQADKPPVTEPLVLHEGDSIRITFPGAPNLNAAQKIGRDGRITLQLVGEVKASGLTAAELEKELLKLYEGQLQTKEVNVAVESSAFMVYVTGAVLRPGKVVTDRPLTALEAIMEAGGFDYGKANLKSVRIIRREGNRTLHFNVNLRRVLQGKQDEPFKLQPADIIYVTERFSWF